MKNILNIFIKDISSYGVFSILSRITGLALLPLFTRIFSVVEYGIIDAIAIFSNLYVVVASLRISASVSRYYNDKSKDIENGELFSTLFILSFCINIIVFLLIINFSEQMSYIFTKTYDYAEFISVACISSSFQSLRKIPLMVLRRERKIYHFSFINLITSFLYAIIAITYVYYFDYGIIGVFYAAALSDGTAFFLSIFLSKKYFSIGFNFKYIKLIKKYSLPLVPGKFVMWANNQINRIIILMLLGLSGMGVFGVGYRIASVIMLLATIFGRAWGPLSMEIIHSGNRKDIIENVLNYYLCIFFSLGIIISIISPEIISFVVPDEYKKSVFVIPWIIGSFILALSGKILNISTAIKEKTVHNSSSELIGFINLSLSYFLIYHFGIYGAGVSLFISQIVSKIFIWQITKNYSEINFDKYIIISSLSYFTIFSIGMLSMVFYYDFNIISITIRYFWGTLFIFLIMKNIDVNKLIKKITIFLKTKIISFSKRHSII